MMMMTMMKMHVFFCHQVLESSKALVALVVSRWTVAVSRPLVPLHQ